jgi:cathepsin D
VACKGAKLKLASSSLQQTGAPFSIRYASGTVGGVVATDNVEMGGFTIQNQVMGLVDQASGVLLSGNTAGLLGLAFQVRRDIFESG